MKRLWLAISLVLALSGCGYGFQGTTGAPPKGVHRLAIPTVENATTYSELTNNLTNGMIQQFNLSKTLRVTAVESADAVLSARIKSVQIDSSARSRKDDTSASRRVVVRVAAVLKLRGSGKILWENSGVTARKTYPVVEDQSRVDANLNAALEDVAQELAEKIHNAVFEGF